MNKKDKLELKHLEEVAGGIDTPKVPDFMKKDVNIGF